MERQEEVHKVVQAVRARNGEALFVQQRLQVLFGRLLRVKAELVMEGFAFPTELCGEPVVRLRLSHPLAGQLFHTRPFPGS